jgi:NADH-quinone oxidoreductase subunit E
MPLTDETRLAAREIVARYPRSRSALLPMLHLVQSEDGYVSPEGVRFCAEELGLTKAEVGAVATFYTMYKRRPTGEYLVSVCTNTLCDVLGGEQIYEALSEHLGVGHDQTTGDGRITLEHAECLAACDYAPVVTVNYEFFDQQSSESATELVEELQAGRRPLPTRGAPLCTFKEISRQLAGFMDERPGAVDAGPAGEPTLIGNRLAVRRAETAPAYDAPAPLDKPVEPAAAPAASAPAPAAAPAGTEAPAASDGTAASAASSGAEAPAASSGAEAPAAPAETAAEESAAAGTAQYGGSPDTPSSGSGEGTATATSDPAADATPDKEAATATSAAPDAPTAGGTAGEATTGTAPGSAAAGTAPGSPDASSNGGTGSADAAGEDSAGEPAADRPAPTNRGRKTRRKEG